MEKEKKDIITQIRDNINEADKMIWLIAVLLMLLSLVAIFSSTSSMAIKLDTSRLSILVSQVGVVFAGIVILLGITALPNVKYIKTVSKYGFVLSLFLLLVIVTGQPKLPFFKPILSNEATRAISVFGFSVQVYEVVKVAMVMYLSWAMTSYEEDKFSLVEKLGTAFPKYLGWMKSSWGKRWIYINIPLLVTTGLILVGSNSSAVLIALIMGMTVVLGGMKVKHIAELMIVGIVGISILVGIHILSNGKFIARMQTFFNRLKIEVPYPDPEVRAKQHEKVRLKSITLEEGEEMSKEEKRIYKDKNLQSRSAELAFVDGGRRILGKGPGKSTQKYIVPLIFEDYMFSFLMEEYGFLGCILVIILYVSLFARGVIIVRNCSKRFAKTCIGGLVFLITFQALFHILINCNIGLLTGQTLPMISHGKSSFLCFTVAFGVILSISRMANNKIRKEMNEARKLMQEDSVKAAVSDIEALEASLESGEQAFEDFFDNSKKSI